MEEKNREENVEENQSESVALTEKDFDEFLAAVESERWKILLAHAERNNKNIQIRRLKKMDNNEQYNDHAYEEIGKQFEEFCHTKGIAAKFKLAFSDMAENARKQKAADKAQLNEVKRKSAEENPEFTEFLHTKGFKAKIKLVIENIKKGARESRERTRKQIADAKRGVITARDYSADELSSEFNAFLKAKGLDGKYVVEITDGADE